jgi:hypothetical protein
MTRTDALKPGDRVRLCGVSTLTSAEQFFYDHAGWSYGPNETSEEGRVRSAREYAAAEQWAKDHDVYFVWELDPMPWDGDVKWTGNVWTCAACADYGMTQEVRVLASLGGIAMEHNLTDPYRRVVEAELAAEART